MRAIERLAIESVPSAPTFRGRRRFSPRRARRQKTLRGGDNPPGPFLRPGLGTPYDDVARTGASSSHANLMRHERESVPISGDPPERKSYGDHEAESCA